MDSIKNFFTSQSFAVVGATNRTDKWGYKVFKRLQNIGKPVFPVHPIVAEIDGMKAYKSLSELPSVPEAVNIIVSPSVTEKIVTECKSLGIKKVWMQPGAESKTAIEYCKANGIDVIYDDCVLRHPNY